MTRDESFRHTLGLDNNILYPNCEIIRPEFNVFICLYINMFKMCSCLELHTESSTQVLCV